MRIETRAAGSQGWRRGPRSEGREGAKSGMTELLGPLRSGGQLAAIIPQTFEDVQRIANVAVKAGLYKADDAETALAQACMVIMQGLECGVPPTQAIQQIAVINGRCVIWGDLLPALVWAKGHKIREWFEGEGDDLTAFCEVTRGNNDERITRSFSVADAKAARLWDRREKLKRKGKDGGWYDKDNDSPWYRFEKRMLQMRARGFACRDGVPDVLHGLYVREELEQPEPIDITPTPVAKQAPDVPDIPDIDVPDAASEQSDAEPVSEEALVAEIEKKLESCTSLKGVQELEQEYATAIMNMSTDGRELAITCIQEAKASMQAEAAE